MKLLFRYCITKILSFQAKRFIQKNHTQVIAITGSIGKTSTKQAVYTLLRHRFKVYASTQGFNTPLGVCLAILQEEHSGFRSAIAWAGIMKRSFSLKQKSPFQKIILEMGSDQPGDISKLVKMIPPHIGIVTNVNPVHLGKGQFETLEDIAREKGQLIKRLPKDGLAIINADDERVKNMRTNAKVMTFGVHEKADVRASDLLASPKDLRFTVTYKDQTANFTVPVIGIFQVYVVLPAIAVGVKMGMSLQECAEALKEFTLPPGRMNPIAGINESVIIDSSYNASPATMEKALDILQVITKHRKIAALGTMNELGEFSKEAHTHLGKQAAKVADVLIAVGPEANTIKNGALENEMLEKDIFTFFDSEEAGHFLKKILEPKDVVLVKGSQNNVRMEKLVRVVMAQPEKAEELLCRQEQEWQKI